MPSRTQSSPSRCARVRMPAGLEPWSASVSPKQPMASPAAIRGSHSCFCSSLPKWWIANIASEPCTETSDRSPESPASSSRQASPYAVGRRAGAAVALQVHAEHARARRAPWPGRGPAAGRPPTSDPPRGGSGRRRTCGRRPAGRAPPHRRGRRCRRARAGSGCGTTSAYLGSRSASGWGPPDRPTGSAPGHDEVGQAVVDRLLRGEDLVPVHVGPQRSTSWGTCRARTSSTWLRIRSISAAWRVRSETVPCVPPAAGWPSRTRACSRTKRRPGLPAGQQDRRRRRRLPDAERRDRRGDEAHRVVDGHERGERAARGS